MPGPASRRSRHAGWSLVAAICLIAALAPGSEGPALAREGDFERYCAHEGCHAGTAPLGSTADSPSCAACHYHGMHEIRRRWGIEQTFHGWTDKPVYEAGEPMTILVTGGDQPGWVRVRIRDHEGRELARATGPTGMGDDGDPNWTASVLPGPIVLGTQAPRLPGTYRWTVGWYGDTAVPNPPILIQGQAVIAHHDHILRWHDLPLPAFQVVSHDARGPSLTGVAVTPAATAGARQVMISSLASDGSSGMTPIGAASGLLLGGATGPGGVGWMALEAADGVFDTADEQVVGVFDIDGLEPGTYTITIKAADAIGNWGGTAQGSFDVTPPPASDVTAPTATCLPPAPVLVSPGQPVKVRVKIDDRGSGGSPVHGAEAFVSAPGQAGAGVVLHATDGLLDSDQEELSATLSTSGLDDGSYPVLMHGRDAAGLWGAYCETSIEVRLAADTDGPSMLNVSPTPAPTAGSRVAVIHAEASDIGKGHGEITAVELIDDPATAPGGGRPMSPEDGAFDSTEERASVALDLLGWEIGAYRAGVRARDAAGNWGPLAWIALEVSDGGEDHLGPRISGLRVGSRPGAPEGEITLSGWIDDRKTGGSRPLHVEYFIESPGLVGSGSTIPLEMHGQRRLRGNPEVTARFEVTIDAGMLPYNVAYPLYVRGMDEHGNWGPLSAVAFRSGARSGH